MLLFVSIQNFFYHNFDIMLEQAAVTLQEAAYGLLIGTAIGFFTATLMDYSSFIHNAFYPLLILTQTIPTVAIAPLLVLWMGFGMAPKITLVVLTTFFPVTIGLLNGYKNIDGQAIDFEYT